ncbi:MAG: hypothetical protein LPK45_06735 [Bacteroidota bacterium]|nr:hypothetical protein [Bacteroidota bacterium]MDX5430769.1 hypothetical protein [Bacteroidota bacterium]MDX5469514.1 hypothetical protein [Bacteroidota bacterium]
MKNSVTPQRDSKSRIYLDLLRDKDYSEKEILKKLDLTPGAFYTLKSRLIPKMVQHYTNLKENRIRLLREEAARISFVVLNNERMISLSFLKDLEKKLIAYDMSSELAVVYKHLARLHRFDDQYEIYERAYQKHIAFSLAVSKAEDLLYEYIYLLGYYHITRQTEYREKLDDLLEELENTFNLYESHRLYTLFNIVRHYHRCTFLSSDELKKLELEVEDMVRELEEIFALYDLDPFYGVIRNLIPFLNFEYYVRIQNQVKAEHYLEEIALLVEFQFKAHLWGFFISQFLLSLIYKLKQDGDSVSFLKLADKFRSGFFIEQNESSHLVIFYRYKALAAFYQNNFSQAALDLNNLLNISTFKELPNLAIELKLFQAFMYALQGDEDLYLKLTASAKRKSAENEDLTVSVKNFSKILFLLNKSRHDRVDPQKMEHYWNRFSAAEGNPAKLLDFMHLNLELLTHLLKKPGI